MTRRVLFAALAFLLLASPALAEEAAERMAERIDLSAWQTAVDEASAGVSLRDALSAFLRGEADWDGLLSSAWDAVAGEAARFAPTLLMLLAPALLWALNRLLLGGSLARAAGWVCCLAEAGMLATLFGARVAEARSMLQRASALAGDILPALTALLVAAGGASGAAFLTPMAALAASLVSKAMCDAAFALCGCAAALAVAGNLSGQIRLKGLFSLCASANTWICGAAITAFLGIVAVSGALGFARDGVTLKTAKYAVDNLLPGVGGEVSDTLDAVAASALLVKNAAGATGLIALTAVCARPIVRVTLSILCCRLAAALSEPIGENPVCDMLGQFAKALGMLLAALSAAMALLYILVGAALGAGGALLAR